MSVDKVETANAQPLLAGKPLIPKVRMTDLARSAGVSVATVSRSLNDSPLINRVTKSRVWQVACDQGYISATDIPESLRDNGPSIALMIPAGPLPHALICGLVEAAREMRCILTLSHLASHDDLAGALQRSDADAFIIPAAPGLDMALSRAGADHRIVVWGEPGPGRSYTTVGPDNFGGARLATAHLAAAGCTRIAYLGDTDGPGMMQRFMGYVTALNDAGLRVAPERVLRDMQPGDYDGLFIAGPAYMSLPGAGIAAVAWHDDSGVSPHIPQMATIGVDMVAAGRIILRKLISAICESEQLPVRLKTT